LFTRIYTQIRLGSPREAKVHVRSMSNSMRRNAKSLRATQVIQKPRKINSGMGRGLIPHPPQLDRFELEHSQSLRFTTSGAISSLSITFENLLDTMLFATTAIAPYEIFSKVKVRRVKVWSVPALGTAASATVVYSGQSAGFSGDDMIHTDTSMGIEPAFVNAAPSRKCLAALFQEPSNSSAFTLSCPAGSVVDVLLSFRGLPNVAIAAQNASVGATVGTFFYRGLDGKAVATTSFILPAGVTQF